MSLLMTPSGTTLGLALTCDCDGVIQQVLHNGLSLPGAELVGTPFPLLVAGSSFRKALSFLVELNAKRMVFDWECELAVGARVIAIHCAGVALDGSLLILAAETRTAVSQLFDDMMKINTIQAHVLRSITKEQAERIRKPTIGDYEELSRLKNDMVALQRAVGRKNVELERLNREVSRISITDDLTHLYNRRGFFEVGHREVARTRRFGTRLSAIMLDIDHFKQFNTDYGHAIGDRVLEGVAARCILQLREVDTAGRYGGEEFAVLLPDVDLASAIVAAERLRANIADEPYPTDVGALKVTISLGVASLMGDAMELEELLGRADQALYQAKAAGRDRVCAGDVLEHEPAGIRGASDRGARRHTAAGNGTTFAAV